MASGKEFNAHTYPGWAVQGLGGMVGIMEAIDPREHQLTDEQRKRLGEYVDRLLVIADRLEASQRQHE
jgi:hypothetical protein